MEKYLVIVESPAKAKTIKKYLGKQFEVIASYGHVRDLLPKEGAVDPEHHFAMRYQAIEKNEKHVEAIAKALKKADALYLATDPDREGEAISWHISELLKEKKLLGKKPVHRVAFYEITKNAVNEAIQHPRDLSMALVNAQQARRALDYLVGFNLSPLLWKKVRRGLSAGRVQSPALRLIVEREEEIEKFISQEYWTIEADLLSQDQKFMAKLAEYQGEKLTQFSITQADQAERARNTLLRAANGKLVVTNIEKKQRKRHPAAPFITSTLQQEAVRKLGLSASRTMRIAQQLYEGVDIGNGAVGLITYMRTDSVNMAQEAIADIRSVIGSRFGKEFLPPEARLYKTKAKNAQEAHEAIRPTLAENIPELIKQYLTDEQYKLYDLIWKRTMACQMISATIDTVSVDFQCGEGNRFRATGSTVIDPGFMVVYQEDTDDAKSENESFLPPLKEGDEVSLQGIRAEQHFTEPPPRYSEASLIKALEEFGIGRPSTYASIVTTLVQREYVLLEQKRFRPTDVGRIVNRFLTQYFPHYVDYEFTARMENELDDIANGEKAWVPVMEEFWFPFKERVGNIEETVTRQEVTHEALDEACPECGKPLSIRLGRRGRFVGCTAYPECKYTRSLQEEAPPTEEEKAVAERKCPTCTQPLQVKFGRYGKFIGCSTYPKCKYVESLQKPTDTGVVCPKCNAGNLLSRKSRRGKIFYSCARYPECDYALWNQPIKEACPKCHWPIMTVKTTKRKGTEKICPQETCKYTETISEPES